MSKNKKNASIANKKLSQAIKRRKPVFESLEPRILLSSDIMPLVDPNDSTLTGALTETINFDTPYNDPNLVQAADTRPVELVVIDAGLTDYQSLLNELRDTGVTDVRREFLFLDTERDGIEQITKTLAGMDKISAMHILSHGDSGALELGSTVLDSGNLEANADAFGSWADKMTADADILLYGCNVANGVAGVAFVNDLARLTGADIAASSDDTGAAAKGGDWELEVSAGAIEAQTLALTSYDFLLDAGSIIQAEIDVLNAGIGELQSWAAALNSFADFAQTLPVLNDSIGNYLQLASQISDLVTEIGNISVGDSADTIAAALNAALNAAGFSFENTSVATGGISFSASLNDSRSQTVTINLDALEADMQAVFADLALTGNSDQNVDLNIDTAFDFSFGIDGDGFYFSPGALTVAASLSANNVTVGLDFASLGAGVGIQNGSLLLTFNGSISLQDDDGRIRLSELQAIVADLASATDVEAKVGLEAVLPLSITTAAFSLDDFGSLKLTLTTENLLAYNSDSDQLEVQAPDVILDVEIAESLKNKILGILAEVDTAIANGIDNPVFNTNIPVLEQTLPELLGLDIASLANQLKLHDLAQQYLDKFSFSTTVAGPGQTLGFPSLRGLFDWLNENVLQRLLGTPTFDSDNPDHAGSNFRNFDFSGLGLDSLRGFNFSGADLRGVDLSGFDLGGIDFSGADLRGAILSAANLRGANFSGADLRGVDLSGALVIGADLRGILSDAATSFANMLFNSSTKTSGNAPAGSLELLSGIDLSGLGLDFSGFDLGGLDLSNINFGGISLAGANLRGAIFSGANLAGVDLSGAFAIGANFSGLDFSGVNIAGLFYNSSTDTSGASNLNLGSAFEFIAGNALTGLDLRGFDLSGLNLFGFDFSGLDLSGVDFSGIDLSGLDFHALFGGGGSGNSAAKLFNVDFGGVDFGSLALDFSGFNLGGINFSGVNFSGLASLSFGGNSGGGASSTRMLGIDFSGVDFGGFDIDFGGLDLSGISFAGVDFGSFGTINFGGGSGGNESILAGVDFSGVSGLFTGINPNFSLAGINLKGANLGGLDWSNFNFDGADLSGALMRGVNLAGATLQNAVLRGVDLAGAALGSVASMAGAFYDKLTSLSLPSFDFAEANEVILDEIFDRPTDLPLFEFRGGLNGNSLDLGIGLNLDYNTVLDLSTINTTVGTPLGDFVAGFTSGEAVARGTAGLDFDFSINLQRAIDALGGALSGNLDFNLLTDDDLALTLNRFDVGASAAILDTAATVGLGGFNAGITDAHAELKAGAKLSLNDPNDDGQLTLAEFKATPLAELIKLEYAGTLDAGMKAAATFSDVPGLGTLNMADFGVPVVTLTSDNIFNKASYSGTFDVEIRNKLQAAITDVVTKWDDVAQNIADNAIVDTEIPLLDTTLEQALVKALTGVDAGPGNDLFSVLELGSVITQYFTDNPTGGTLFGLQQAVTDELKTRFAGSDGKLEFGGELLTVTFGLYPESQELRMDVVLNAREGTTVNVDLANTTSAVTQTILDALTAMGLSVDAAFALQLDAALTGDFTFGFDLSNFDAGNPAIDQVFNTENLYLKVNDPLTLTTSVTSDDINLAINGFSVNGGTMDLVGSASIDLINPDGDADDRLTLKELGDYLDAGNNFQDLFVFDMNGSLDSRLPIDVDLNTLLGINADLSDFGNVVLMVQGEDLLSYEAGVGPVVTAPQLLVDFSLSQTFIDKILSILGDIDAAIDDGLGNPVLTDSLPLINQSITDLIGIGNLADQINLRDTAADYLNDVGFTKQVGVPDSFPTLRGLLDALNEKLLAALKGGVSFALDTMDWAGEYLRGFDFAGFEKSLRGFNFSGADLRGVDFSGFDLGGIDFSGADLRGVNFSGANLRGVNFSGANLGGVDLSGALALGANFSDAIFNSKTNIGNLLYGFSTLWPNGSSGGAGSSSGFGTAINFGAGIDLSGLGLDFSGFDLSGLNLSGINLSGISLAGANLRGTNLSNAILNGVDLSGAWAIGANFSGIDFSGIGSLANLFYNSSTDTSGSSGLNLASAFEFIAGNALTGLDLRGFDLSGLDLTGFDFSGLDLSGVSFSGIDFSGLDFHALFGGGGSGNGAASLFGVDFGDAVFSGVSIDFSGFNLTGIDFSGVDFSGLTGLLFGGGSGTQSRGIDFSGVDFGSLSLDFSGLDLAGSLFKNIDFSGLASLSFGSSGGGDNAGLNGIDFSGINFGALNIDWSGFDLSGANLSGIDFSNFTLTGIDFSGANLGGIDFSNFDLSGVNFTGAFLEGVNLAGATLQNAVLRGIDLANTIIDGATDLAGAFYDALSKASATLQTVFSAGNEVLLDEVFEGLEDLPEFAINATFEDNILKFQLQSGLEFNKELDFDLSLGDLLNVSGETILFDADASGRVVLKAGLGLDIEAGLDLNRAIDSVSSLASLQVPDFGNLITADDLYFKVNRMNAGASAALTGVNATMTVAGVGAGISNAFVNLRGAADLQLNDPNDDGKITLQEFQDQGVGNIVSISAAGSVDAGFAVDVFLPDLGFLPADVSDFGRLVVSIEDDNVFETIRLGQLPNLSLDIELGSNAQSLVLDILDKIKTVGDDIQNSTVLNTELPLIGKTLNELLSEGIGLSGNVLDFHTAVNSYFTDAAANGQAPTVKGLIKVILDQAFGAFGEVGAITFDNANKEILFNLSFQKVISLYDNETFSIDLADALADMGVDISGINVTGDGVIDIELLAGFDVQFGFDLNGGINFFVDNSKPLLNAGLRVTGTDLNLTTTIDLPFLGEIDFGITGGTIVLDGDGVPGKLDANDYAGITISLVDGATADGRIYSSEFGSASFAANVGGSFLMELPFYILDTDFVVATPTVTGDITNNGIENFAADLNTLNAELIFKFINENPDVLVDALLDILNRMKDGLESKLDMQLPFLGNLASIVGENHLLAKMITEVENLKSVIDARKAADPNITTLDLVAEALTEVFQSFLGSGIVVVHSSDSAEGWFQFNVQMSDTITYQGISLEFEAGIEGLGLEIDSDVLIDLELGYGLDFGFGFDFDDGFYFDANGDANGADAGFEGKELALYASATLAEGSSLSGSLGFLELMATEVGVAVEQADAADPNSVFKAQYRDGEASGIYGAITLDLVDPENTDGLNHLTIDDIGNAGGIRNVVVGEINAYADLDIDVVVGINATDIQLPEVSTRLHYRQDFVNAVISGDGNTFAFGGSPEVIFEAVSLDLGQAIGGFIGPVAEKVDNILEPIKPIIKLLKTEIDLGITSFELIDLARLVLTPAQFNTVDKAIDAIDAVIQLIEAIAAAEEARKSGESLLINFGDFVVGQSLLLPEDQQSATALDDGFAEGGNSNTGPDLGAATSGKSQGSQDVVSQMTVSEGAFRFPILQDPKSLFGLLMGKDVDLFIYDLPKLDLNFEYVKSYPIFTGLNARIGGYITAKTDFSFGFDTSGIRAFAFGNDGAFGGGDDFQVANLPLIFNGFFVDDYDQNDQEKPEVTLTAGLVAGASLGVGGLVEAGVQGGVEAVIHMDLNDPDNRDDQGKLYVDEVIKQISRGPHCLFDYDGALSVFLEAFLWIGLDIGFSKITIVDLKQRFVDEVIASFEYSCPPPKSPDIASLSGRTLNLRYSTSENGAEGGFADLSHGYEVQRVDTLDLESLYDYTDPLLVTETGANMRVDNANDLLLTDKNGRDLVALAGENPSGGFVVVKSRGIVEVFRSDEIDNITTSGTSVVDDKGRSDNYSFGSSLTQNLNLSTGAGIDRISVLDGGNVTIDGQGGDDHIRVSSTVTGNIDIQGGSGDDSIELFLPKDASENYSSAVLKGGSGSDYIVGGDKADTIFGDGHTLSGDDVLSTGADGGDDIYAGGGDDIIYGGHEPFVANPAEDVRTGDYIDAGAGHDTVRGGGGQDVIHGGLGNDILMGGTGSDTIFGEDDNDTIYGVTDTSTDNREGGEFGRDTLYGGAGDDVITGGNGDDYLNGGTDINGDTLYGKGGSDLFDWQLGDGIDIIYGHDDVVTGFANVGVTDSVYMHAWTEVDRFTKANDDSDDVIGVSARSGGDVAVNWNGEETVLDGINSIKIDAGTGADNLTFGDLRTTTLKDTLDPNTGEITKAGVAVVLGSGRGTRTVQGDQLFNDDGSPVQAYRLLRDANGDLIRDADGKPQYELDGNGDFILEDQYEEYTLSGKSNDNQADVITILGEGGVDRFTLTSESVYDEELDQYVDSVRVAQDGGISFDVSDVSSSLDRLVVDGGQGDDRIDASALDVDLFQDLRLLGREGEDRLIGSQYSDMLIGGTGADVITGGRGVDVFHHADYPEDAREYVGGVLVKDILLEEFNADYLLSNDSLTIGIDDVIDEDAFNPGVQTALDRYLLTDPGAVAYSETEDLSGYFEEVDFTGGESSNLFKLGNWSGGGVLDGAAAGDNYEILLSQAAQDRNYLNIDDQGADGIDELLYKGSSEGDLIQLDTVYIRNEDPAREFTDDRWNDIGNERWSDIDNARHTQLGAHGEGLIIAHFDDVAGAYSEKNLDDTDALLEVSESKLADGNAYQVVNYSTVDVIKVFGGLGDDKFVSDDTAANFSLYGNEGDDQFFVGSILETEDVVVEGKPITVVKQVTHGARFNMSFYGGADDDYFEVNHNAADIALYGDNGDDVFFIKALLTLNEEGDIDEVSASKALVSAASGEDSEESQINNDTREVDIDTLVYVENANVKIDGGAGFDAVAVVGTALSDTFYIFTEDVGGKKIQRIYGAGVKLRELLNVERLMLITGAGDDRVYIYGVDLGPVADMLVNTGTGSDTVIFGGEELTIDLNFPESNNTEFASVDGYTEGAEYPVAYGLGIDYIDYLDRVVPFNVTTPSHTRTKVIEEVRTLDNILSPITIQGIEGENDKIIVNDQLGSGELVFEDKVLVKKGITTDRAKIVYPALNATPALTDLLSRMNSLTDAEAADVQDMINEFVTNLVKFNDKYIDNALIDRIFALTGGEVETVTIPDGTSYAVFQDTLDENDEFLSAKTQFEDYLSGTGFAAVYVTNPHPDPSKTALLYEMHSIVDVSAVQNLVTSGVLVASGNNSFVLTDQAALDAQLPNINRLAFQAQYEEFIKDSNTLLNLIGVSLVTAGDVNVDLQAGYITGVPEILDNDRYNTLYRAGTTPFIFFDGNFEGASGLDVGGIDEFEIYMNSLVASTFTMDNPFFAGKTFVYGGSAGDTFNVNATAGQTFLNGGDGNDTFNVGDGTVDAIGKALFLNGGDGTDSVTVFSQDLGTDVNATLEQKIVQRELVQDRLSKITNALEYNDITPAENLLIAEGLKVESVDYAVAGARVSLSDLTGVATQATTDMAAAILAKLQDSLAGFNSSITDLIARLQGDFRTLIEGQIKAYASHKSAEATYEYWRARHHSIAQYYWDQYFDPVNAILDFFGLDDGERERIQARAEYHDQRAAYYQKLRDSQRASKDGVAALLSSYFTTGQLNQYYSAAWGADKEGVLADLMLDPQVTAAIALIATNVNNAANGTVAALNAAITSATSLEANATLANINSLLNQLASLNSTLSAAVSGGLESQMAGLERQGLTAGLLFAQEIDALNAVKDLLAAVPGQAAVDKANAFRALSNPTFDDAVTLYTDADFVALMNAYDLANDIARNFVNYKSADYTDFRVTVRNMQRFEVFRENLTQPGGFSFNAFKQDYLDNVAALNDQIDLFDQLAEISRYEAQLESLAYDKIGTTQVVNQNDAVYLFFSQLHNQAVSDLATLEVQLEAQYTITINYFFFATQEIKLDYTGDPRYKAAVKNVNDTRYYRDRAAMLKLDAERDDAALTATIAAITTDMNNLLGDPLNPDSLSAKLIALQDLKDELSAQFELLRNLGRVTIDVVTSTRDAAAASGFEDFSSLISDIQLYSNTFTVTEDPGVSSTSEVFSPGASGNSIVKETRISEFWNVLSLEGLNSGGIHANYDTIENFTLLTGSGNDTIQIKDSLGQADSLVDIYTNGGNDTLNVLSDEQSVDDVVGHLYMDAGTGTNELFIDDRGDTSGDTIVQQYNNTYVQLVGMAAGDINYRADGGFGNGLQIHSSSGHDDFTIRALHGDDHTEIFGADGDDLITVEDFTVDPAATLTIRGNNGDDTINALASPIAVTAHGNDGDDIIDGSRFGDVLTGDADNDVIRGFDGDDDISGNDGEDILYGELGVDTIDGGADGDIVFGGSGQFLGNHVAGDGVADTSGDILSGGSGNDILFGGLGADTINGDAGRDAIFGGHGLVERTAGGLMIGANGRATNPNTGGAWTLLLTTGSDSSDDILTSGSGGDFLFGGLGNDVITGDSSGGVLIGDQGQVNLTAAGVVTRAASTEPDIGGDDIINTDEGDNIVIAGQGADNITAGSGRDILIGDNGEALFDSDGLRVAVRSIDTLHGGNDTIATTGGFNLVIGGQGDDNITGGIGDDRIIGDNGEFTFINGIVNLMTAYDADNTTAGNDLIHAGDGRDLVAGGLGNDEIHGEEGDDYIVGDNGQFFFLQTGETTVLKNSGTVWGDDGDPLSLDVMYSTDPYDGGDDLIVGGTGNDTLIGGAANDQLFGQQGDDLISGDAAQAVYRNWNPVTFETIDMFIGGSDELSGGEGLDVMLGGFGGDLFFGDFSEDAIIGEYARVRLDGDKGLFVVRLGQGNLDLIASNQFGLYSPNALEHRPSQPTDARPLPPVYGRPLPNNVILENRFVERGNSGHTADPSTNIPGARGGQTGQGGNAAQPAGECPTDYVDQQIDGVTPDQPGFAPSECVAPTSTGDSGRKDKAASVDADTVGAAIAGITGWQAFKRRERKKESAIDKSGFDRLSAANRKRKFRSWDSVTETVETETVKIKKVRIK